MGLSQVIIPSWPIQFKACQKLFRFLSYPQKWGSLGSFLILWGKLAPAHMYPSSKALELKGFIIFLLHSVCCAPPHPSRIFYSTEYIEYYSTVYRRYTSQFHTRYYISSKNLSLCVYYYIFFFWKFLFFFLSFFTGYLSIFSFLLG